MFNDTATTEIYTFLLALENQPRIMRIRSFTLRKAKKAPQGHMQADIELSVFFDSSEKDR